MSSKNFETTQVKAIIFDWAGTLIDHGCQAPMEAFQLAFREAANLNLSPNQIAPFMGMAKRHHIQCILREVWSLLTPEQQKTEKESEALTDSVYASFKKYLSRTVLNHLDLTPHSTRIIEQLRDCKIAVGSTTGYNSETVWQILGKLGKETAEKLPHTFVASDHVPVTGRRPAPSMIYQNLATLGINCKTQEVIKVGDTLLDIDEGNNAGCWTVGVINTSAAMGLSREEFSNCDPDEIATRQLEIEWAFRDRGADFIIKDLSELPQVINEIDLYLNKSVLTFVK